MKKKPLGYLGGDIMSFGSGLARKYEYEMFKELELPVDVYSPILNDSINDKKSVTEEENNHLAEKITEADIERLWNSDFVVMCPEQSAIGSLCETGCLFGWKWMAFKLMQMISNDIKLSDDNEIDFRGILIHVINELDRIISKKNYFHYEDIRDTDLYEKGWRRSFSINQLLYGMVLYTAEHGDFESFDGILEHLKEEYGKRNKVSGESDQG